MSTGEIKRNIPWKKDIPRFQNEPPLVGVPSRAEDSVFNDPVVAETSELAADFLSPRANSSSRDTSIRRFIGSSNIDGNSSEKVMSQLGILQEASSRAHMYEDLVRKLEKSLGISQKKSLAKEVRLPEVSSLKISQEAIDLVNACFYAAHPDSFGKTIPILHNEDVRIISDGGFAEYTNTYATEIAHSYWGKNFKLPQLPDCAVMPMLPGKPIFFTESMMHSLDGIDSLTKSQIIAKLLIHENTHRFAKTVRKKTNDGDPLLGIAFSGLSNDIYLLPEGDERARQEAKLDEIWEYMISHDPEVEIEGALMRLYCRDKDRQMKQFTSTGYDINEIIVDLVSRKAIQNLYSHINKTQKAASANNLIEILSSDEHQMTSVNVQKVGLTESLEYLSSLGLHSDEAILQAYYEGTIPLLHIEKKPGENYYP